MISIGLLVICLFTSQLVAWLDMLVYQESFPAALSRQVSANNHQSQFIMAMAFVISMVGDFRRIRARNRRKKVVRNG
ncbi:hypothetical protein [Paenibacillus mucilaginosus]|uniref:hypothetical protein n=1 Tax=Paenibacillus mucilaginosus TaxID=61624 RepID=UPI0005A1DE4C|nr:hypothetical protein [Paenibacillus mucilaginosus]MCG7214943.1 hypothetical protein [Paenibacillus mucilaginosus]WDM26417.1 hypothetical protein KCX80_28945 [Paenibacillus mucilaginosus]